MEEKNKNEEIQSRREFFKQAAKKALPVIGIMALVNVPIYARATAIEAMGCNNDCKGGCYTGCYGDCKGGCQKCCGGCDGTCKNTCKGCSE